MMATENSNLTTPVESVGIAEDVQNVTSVESANVNVVAEDESQTENVNPAEVVDFAEVKKQTSGVFWNIDGTSEAACT